MSDIPDYAPPSRLAQANPMTPRLYPSLNAEVLGMVPFHTRRLLDLGCGTGTFGSAVKARQPCDVVGVTFSQEEANLAALKLDRVVVADLNEYDLAPLGGFDTIVCSHVLEHLYRPEDLLTRLHPSLATGGELLVALPNVLFWRQRVRFLCGTFRYTDGGLMDVTHYRFFDWHTARELLIGSGFEVAEAVSDAYLPGSWLVPPLRGWFDRLAAKSFPGLFGIQFRFRCSPRARHGGTR